MINNRNYIQALNYIDSRIRTSTNPEYWIRLFKMLRLEYELQLSGLNK